MIAGLLLHWLLQMSIERSVGTIMVISLLVFSVQKLNREIAYQFFAHILRHLWFWPIEFWLRPLTVLERSQKAKIAELFAALIGCGLWGALIGGFYWWLIHDNIQTTMYDSWHMIWVVAVCFALAGAFAVEQLIGFIFALLGVIAIVMAYIVDVDIVNFVMTMDPFGD